MQSITPPGRRHMLGLTLGAALLARTRPARAAEAITYLFPAPDFLPAFAPFQLARARGYFAKAGLDVSFQVGKGGADVAKQVALDNVDCYGINGQLGSYMIDLVKQAQKSHTLLVFLFHGVGGGHPLNVDLAAHRQLLRYLKAHEQEIDIAPMVEVAESIRAYQQGSAARK